MFSAVNDVFESELINEAILFRRVTASLSGYRLRSFATELTLSAMAFANFSDSGNGFSFVLRVAFAGT